MDAVELARQSAAALYAATVAAGYDPRKPYAFALAAAGLRDLDVETAKPGATVLEGSKATLAPKRLIIHEKAGSPFEQAFLVAHEIGHAELGDAVEDEEPGVMDPARAAEPPPDGFERVGYSRQQRREIQMDLFGRELLLPRQVLRSRHLDDGRTASEIADEFGAPFEVVAQQLFDGLLLPVVAAVAEPEPKGGRPSLNARQLVAARRRKGPYLLAAGPGTGKTQTLTGRVALLLEQTVDPRSILLLTFSNKAAGEMAERIARIDGKAAAAMQIATFHSFGLDLIKRFMPSSRPKRLMDRAEAVELLEERFPGLDLKVYRNLYDPTQIVSDMLAAISRAKDEVVDEHRYAELAEGMASAARTPEAKAVAAGAADVAKVYAEYERLKAENGCLDFGDLVMNPVRLMEKDEKIRNIVRERCKHVLVDEYQDVNRASVRFLKTLCGEGENLWAVGDARQSIYRFRGASSFNTTRFGNEDFAGGRRGRLQVNYRSSQEIVDGFSSFSERMPAVSGRLRAHRGSDGSVPELRTVVTKDLQSPAIAEAIEEMRLAGHKFGDQAVLCTGNEKLSNLARELEQLGIPVLFLGSLFERPEVKELLSFLSLLCDPRAMGLARVAGMSCFAMAMPDVDKMLAFLHRSPSGPKTWKDAAEHEGVTEEGRRGLGAVVAALRGFDPSSSPWLVLAALLLDRSRLAAELSSATDVAGRTRAIAIWQLMNFLRVQPTGRGANVSRLLDRVKRLVRLGDERDLRQLPAAAKSMDGVHLMTIHQAKGLEFPVVHISGMNADTLPRHPGKPKCPPPDQMIEGAECSGINAVLAGHGEEQECLFYVAASRARDRLFLYAPTETSNGRRRSVSPFVERLGSGRSESAVTPSLDPPDTRDEAALDLAVHGVMRFSGEQIALYESCPRRFFYAHVLRIGGRRTESPYMRMHEAVRSVVRGVVDLTVDTSTSALDAALAGSLAANDLDDPDYRQYAVLARSLVDYFLSTRAAHLPEAIREVVLDIAGDEIVVRADDMLVDPNGIRRFRRVRTGHIRTKEDDDVGAAIFKLAAQAAFPDATSELVHLSDGKVGGIPMSAKVLGRRRETLERFLRDIRAGRFPASPSERTCPRCPAFFICGPVPSGPLVRTWGRS
jgi:superfamily I DNA/RNA helicase/Zn-dependent peptidase ImmA (M78 family)